MSLFNKTIAVTTSFIAVFAMSASTLAATGADEFGEAKELVASRVSCQQLSNEQLEKIGDYAMEQMAPGAAHTQMEQMMGGEGSESLRQAHIFMARRWYCGDATGYGMMGMMLGGFGPGMMGSGAILNNPGFSKGFTGMMGGFGGYAGYGNWNGGWIWMAIFPILGTIFLISGIAAFLKYLSNRK
ncbi:MAG: hypothetical protein HY983_03470 [Candidatus Magasanikbacteria bacterium]|nr:hypothetical protein [Candidatus Magasanikbacteria bacterium]